MRVINIEEGQKISKLKNKEEFCDRLIQEILMFLKNNPLSFKTNEKIKKIDKQKEVLLKKESTLNDLLVKSSNMKIDLDSKIKLITENNELIKSRLLNSL